MNTLHRTLTLLACIVMAAALLGCAATPQQANTGQHVDNTDITTKVKAAIFKEPA